MTCKVQMEFYIRRRTLILYGKNKWDYYVKGLTHLDKEDADVVHNLDPHCFVRVRHLADSIMMPIS